MGFLKVLGTSAVAVTGVLVGGLMLLMVDDGGPVETRSIHVAGFDQLAISHGILADVMTGGDYAVALTGQQRDFETTRFSQDNSVLSVSRDSNLLSMVRTLVDRLTGRGVDMRFTVTLPQLSGVTASLGGSVSVIDLDAQELVVSAQTGGQVRLSGKLGTIRMRAESGSAIEATDLTIGHAEIDATTGAVAHLNVTETLRVRSASAARVLISGNPPQRDETTSSGGQILFQN